MRDGQPATGGVGKHLKYCRPGSSRQTKTGGPVLQALLLRSLVPPASGTGVTRDKSIVRSGQVSKAIVIVTYSF